MAAAAPWEPDGFIWPGTTPLHPLRGGRADVLTPGLAGRGAMWGPPFQQCPGPRPSGPPLPQQSSGLLQTGWKGTEEAVTTIKLVPSPQGKGPPKAEAFLGVALPNTAPSPFMGSKAWMFFREILSEKELWERKK